jgi:hypothetical protein
MQAGRGALNTDEVRNEKTNVETHTSFTKGSRLAELHDKGTYSTELVPIRLAHIARHSAIGRRRFSRAAALRLTNGREGSTHAPESRAPCVFPTSATYYGACRSAGFGVGSRGPSGAGVGLSLLCPFNLGLRVFGAWR